MLFGALALVLVFVQIAAPSFEPKPSVEAQIGEIAGEIKRSAWRTFLGLPKPEVKAEAAPLSYYLALAAPILGIVAILLSLISSILRENWRYAAYGVSLGATAIVFQYFWWLALVIAAVVLLVSDKFLPGMQVAGFTGAIVAAIAIAIVTWLISLLLGALGLA